MSLHFERIYFYLVAKLIGTLVHTSSSVLLGRTVGGYVDNVVRENSRPNEPERDK